MKQCPETDDGTGDTMTVRYTIAGTFLATLVFSASANAQSDYPSRPIQLIVPYGPGGVADVGMRIMAEKLSIRLKQNVVVENRPGAGGQKRFNRCAP